MSIRKGSALLLSAVLVAMFGCQSAKTLDDQIRSHLEGRRLEGKVMALDAGLERDLQILSAEVVEETGARILYLRIQNIRSSDIRFDYALRFYAGNRPIEGINANWLPMMILQNDSAFIRATMPLNEVDRFEFVVKKGGKNEI